MSLIPFWECCNDCLGESTWVMVALSMDSVATVDEDLNYFLTLPSFVLLFCKKKRTVTLYILDQAEKVAHPTSHTFKLALPFSFPLKLYI